ncbi:MAG TPA: S1 RNA-binding domain-containing protein [Anaerolineales bacterium]
MVNKLHHRETQGEPPPLDESWWEAVLAEDEAEGKSFNSKTLTPSGPTGKASASANAANDSAPMNWAKAIELYEKDEALNLDVTGYNRGGLLVCGAELQGFVPVSHLVEMPCQKNEEEQEEWLASYVGKPLLLKVIECDQERGRVVFSERAALAEAGSRNQLLQVLQTGDCVPGTVTNITDFGVFVDLGGVEGLIHVSEISWGRVRHPRDVVKLGQQVRVYVIHVEQDRARVALSLKRLCPNPWETVQSRYFPGQLTEAVITSVVPFGAFARLEEGLDGLIHVSELSYGEGGTNPNGALAEGQRVKVRVLHVDGSKQRLGLSLRLNEKS